MPQLGSKPSRSSRMLRISSGTMSPESDDRLCSGEQTLAEEDAKGGKLQTGITSVTGVKVFVKCGATGVVLFDVSVSLSGLVLDS